MTLSEADHERITEKLDREPTRAENALFENLWSEHCAYRSSRPLLSALESDGEQVVVGPGDDAAVVALPTDDDSEDMYITLGIESHNHPSYVDPYDGAATGVGGIVRDTLSMGAYPIALTDSLYFGEFDREHSRYLFDGVVEGIADYGNAIGVPTVGGSVSFHSGYEGNPLVNVACVGLLPANRLVTAEAQQAGNKLVLVGNATGRDGLGGASFASEDLAEDAETEERPAVQVGDPYAEKRLIEANEQLIDEQLVESARDLGAAGLGGASAEMVAKGDFGARIELDRVHQREPGMNALEILLAESQERMCYEVIPENTERVSEIADRFDLGCSVIGEVTEGNYTCTFEGSEALRASDVPSGEQSDPRGRENVTDVPATFLDEGAPPNDLPAEAPTESERDLPSTDLETAFERVIEEPNTASREWVYRQYDHEVGLRTVRGPGDDSAVMAIHETDEDIGLAVSAGAEPNWTAANPKEGARAVALENATNLAANGATPLAAVDCLNGGNPEKPTVYGGFSEIVDGLAEMCASLSIPVVGGNVSLYNDSIEGPIPPTPTVAMVGTRDGYEAPQTTLAGDGTLLVVGDRALAGHGSGLGGSVYIDVFAGSDRFPTLPENPSAFVETLADVADHDATGAVHDVSHGGLCVTLAEMISPTTGAVVDIDGPSSATEHLFHEQPGRAVIETQNPKKVREAFADVAPVHELGESTGSGTLELTVSDTNLSVAAETIEEHRAVLEREMD